MRHILSVTIPIYLLIAVGFLAVRGGLFEKVEMRVIGKFVLNFCLPALVFNALSQRTLGEVLHPSYLLAYMLGSLLMLFGGLVYSLRVQRKPWTLATLQALGVSGSNSGLIGFPIVAQLIGPTAAVSLALNMLIENLLIIPLAMALADSGANRTERWQDALLIAFRGLLRNPLIIAILAGLMCALIGLRLPEPVTRTIQIVSTAASPLALFLIGGTLVGLQVRGLLADVGQMVFAKLVLFPLVVMGLLLVLPPIDPLLRSAAVVMAAMPMMSMLPLLAQKYHHEEFCAAALLAATVCSFFTISAWIWGLGELDGWLP